MPAAAGSDPSPHQDLGKWEKHDAIGDLEVLLPDFPSRGHGTGSWDATLLGSEGAGEALDALVPGRALPVGTLFVQKHRQRHVGEEIGYFVMEKQRKGYFPAGGDWEYAVVRRDGRVEHRGKLEPCARCHAEAAVGFVFPVVAPEPAASR